MYVQVCYYSFGNTSVEATMQLMSKTYYMASCFLKKTTELNKHLQQFFELLTLLVMSRHYGQQLRTAPVGAAAKAEKKVEYYYFNNNLDKWVSNWYFYKTETAVL